MLGSHSEADDAVKEAWIRFSRSDTSAVVDPRNWLTTVVSRLCLDMLQARRSGCVFSLSRSLRALAAVHNRHATDVLLLHTRSSWKLKFKTVVGRGGLEPPTSALSRRERRSVVFKRLNDVTGRYQF